MVTLANLLRFLRPIGRSVGLALVVLTVAGVVSCRDAVRAFGPTTAVARIRAGDFFSSMAARYTNVEESASYDSTRRLIARATLSPSRVFDDSAAWTSAPAAASRSLLVSGSTVSGHYLLQTMLAAPSPVRPGDARHSILLTRSGVNTYSWDTMVEFGIGRLTAADADALFAALFATADGRSESQLRTEFRSAFARAALVLDQLFSVDTLRPLLLPDGGTLLTVTIGLKLQEFRARYPDFAQYLARYLETARYRFSVLDRQSNVWLEITAANGKTTLRFRTLHGHLAPMSGEPVTLPDTLQLDTDFALKLRMFAVGVRRLHSDIVITHSEHESAWTIVSRQEPAWELPLATKRFVRASLSKPFEGSGVVIRLAVHDGDAAQTLITRSAHFTVQESALVRFLGGLSAHAVNDFSERSERQENAYLRELFAALDLDVLALLPAKQNAADR